MLLQAVLVLVFSYAALLRSHLEKARNRITIKTRPISANTPLQNGFASSHWTNENARDPIMVRMIRPPITSMLRAMIAAMKNFGRDISPVKDMTSDQQIVRR